MGGPFDEDFWERHWAADDSGSGSMSTNPPNPYLARELGDLTPGTALDAGCGAGAEALWLASRGWRVTAVDISAEALAHAVRRAEGASLAGGVDWVRADLGTWAPPTSYDLVTTHYAHPAMPMLDFYDRIADWVSPGGTLLLVGHLGGHGTGHGHGHGSDGPPAEASVTAAAVTTRLDPGAWEVVTAEEGERALPTGSGGPRRLHDVVVRAVRRGKPPSAG